MKKFLVILLLAAFAVVGLGACAPSNVMALGQPGVVLSAPAPVTAEGVQLPVPLQALLAVGVGYLVTQGLKSASRLFGADLTKNAAAITAGLVTSATLFINSLLSLIPPNAQAPVENALILIVSVLSVYGVHYSIKGLQDGYT